MERLSRKNCLQEKTGSCMGCPIQDAATSQLKKIVRNQRPDELIKISRKRCPEGNIMQMPEIRKPSLM